MNYAVTLGAVIGSDVQRTATSGWRCTAKHLVTRDARLVTLVRENVRNMPRVSLRMALGTVAAV